MQILIGCAKDMREATAIQTPPATRPLFADEADELAAAMQAYGEDELRRMFGISLPLAREVRRRYAMFFDSATPVLPAITAYNGVVFVNLGLENFSGSDFLYAQHHLWITSFLYGLLRPLDGIKNYRMEGKTQPGGLPVSMFRYWQDRLTDVLIETTLADGGILVDLASAEMRQLFHWGKIEKALRVVKPEFRVMRNGIAKNLAVYAKKGRGAMTAWIIRNRISSPDELPLFEAGGFAFSTFGAGPDNPIYLI